MFKKILGLCVFTFVLLGVANIATAQTEQVIKQVSFHDLTLDSSVYNSGGVVRGLFVINNPNTTDFNDVYYKVSLVGAYDKNNFPNEIYNSSDLIGPFLVSAGTALPVELNYTLPKNIAGDLGIQVRAMTKAGKSLAWTDVKIKVNGQSKFVVFDKNELEIAGKKYSVGSGPMVNDGQKVTLIGALLNPAKTSVTVTPVIKVYDRVITGTPIYSKNLSPVVLSAGKSKDLSIDLPLFDYTPKVYAGTIEFVDQKGVSMSAAYDFRYIVAGDIVTVQSTSLTGEGNKVQVETTFTGAPFDISTGATRKQGNGTMSVSVSNEKGVLLGTNTTNISLDGTQSISSTIDLKGTSTALQVKVEIKKGDKILATYTANPVPHVLAEKTGTSLSFLYVILITIVLFLLFAFGVTFIKRKLSTFLIVGLLIAGGVGLFGFGGRALAGRYPINMYPVGSYVYVISPNYGELYKDVATNITWNYANVDTVEIQLVNGTASSTIVKGIPASLKTYSWTPRDFGSSYKIRIIATKGVDEFYDESDAVFKVVLSPDPTVYVASPNYGELYKDVATNITWYATNAESVDIRLVNNKTSTSSVIASNVPAASGVYYGKYDWVPTELGDYKISITAKIDTRTKVDLSDSVFKVVPNPNTPKIDSVGTGTGFILTLVGTKLNQNPTLDILIDGVKIVPVYTLSPTDGTKMVFPVPTNLTPGNHTVQVSSLNGLSNVANFTLADKVGDQSWVALSNYNSSGVTFEVPLLVPSDITVRVSPGTTLQSGQAFGLQFHISAFACDNNYDAVGVAVSYPSDTVPNQALVGDILGKIVLGQTSPNNKPANLFTSVNFNTFADYSGKGQHVSDLSGGDYFAPTKPGVYRIYFTVINAWASYYYGLVNGYQDITVVCPANKVVDATTGNCVDKIVDLCPNIAGDQLTLPNDKVIDTTTKNCINKIIDLCPNIVGDQVTIPEGQIKDTVTGNCITNPCPGGNCPSTCPNGQARDASGNCPGSCTGTSCPCPNGVCVTPGPGPSGSGACSVQDANGRPITTINIGQQVIWQVNGTTVAGTNYTWSGNGVTGSPTGSQYSVIYRIIGDRTVYLTTNGGTPQQCTVGTGTGTGTTNNVLRVVNNPDFQEF